MHKYYVCIFLVFCLAFSMRIYAINHKTTLYYDDPYSFIASTPNNLSPDGTFFKYYWSDLRFKTGKNHNAYEAKKALFESKSDLKSIYKDLKTLHNYTIDPQHPNLYYSILRIWAAGVDFTNPKAVIVRGCSLNLIFFMFSFFFMYKLLSLIKNDKKFIALGLFFAFVTTGSISDSLLIRPYPLIETFFTFAIYVFAVIYFSVNKNINFSIKKIVLYALGISAFLLSGYYSLLLLVLTYLIISIRCLKYKDIKIFKTYFIILTLSFVITLLFCPMYFENFKIIEHMNATTSSVTIWNIIDIWQYGLFFVGKLIEFLYYNFGFYIILYVLMLIGISVFGNNRLSSDEFEKFIIIFSTALSWAYLIVIISPSHELYSTRYFLACFPTLSILLTLMTYYFKDIFIINLVTLTMMSTFIPIQKGFTLHSSIFKNLGVITYYNYDYDFNITDIIYNNKGKLRPVVFVNKHWGWPSYIFYMPNDATFRIEKKLPTKKYFLIDYILINENPHYIEVIDKKKKSKGYLKLKN